MRLTNRVQPTPHSRSSSKRRHRTMTNTATTFPIAIGLVLWLLLPLHVFAEDSATMVPSLDGPMDSASCANTSRATWAEALAVSRIVVRQPVLIPQEIERRIPDRTRVQVRVCIGRQGEVLEVRESCGEPDLLAGIARSVKDWRFKPLDQQDGPAETSLTFRLKNGVVGLIWESKDYPINETKAASLIRALPRVASLLKRDPRLTLEVDWYPEERDGVFYLFHLYQSGKEMNFTLGWYWLNAYTGEVWDGLQFEQVKSSGLRKLSSTILRQSQVRAEDSPYYRVTPWQLDSRAVELLKDPCADRPPAVEKKSKVQ